MLWYHAARLEQGASEVRWLYSRYIGGLGYVAKYYDRMIPDWMLLGETSPTLWIYQKGELTFQNRDLRSQITTNFSDSIQAVVRQFSGHATRLIIVPIPTKAAIERQHLPEPLRQTDEFSAANFEAFLKIAPTHMVDLYRIFSEYKKTHPDAALYHPLDSHWTSLGIALATHGVLENLAGARKSASSTRFRVRQMGILPDPGDDGSKGLLTPLQLPVLFIRTQPSMLWEEPVFEPVFDGQRPLRPGGRIIVAGTSFSEKHYRRELNFGNVLARALGRTLVDVSVAGAGPEGSLQRLNERQIKIREDDLFVWEFPLSIFSQNQNIPKLNFED